MKRSERIDALVQLGERLQQEDDYLKAIMHRTQYNNAWFTIENQEKAVRAIAEHFLKADKLDGWLARYDIPEQTDAKTVGLVMAGNIPLVGFHDWLCIFTAGHHAKVKLSDKDQYLFPYLLKLLAEIDKRTASYTEMVDRLSGFDAVIATGSNNSARYFEAYFGRYPHIIRRNRHGVAVLTGEETQGELLELGKDIFQYYGLGCRNVAKLYLPKLYDFDPLLEALHEYREIVMNTKYKNNFDYNYALYTLNKAAFKANGCVMLVEETALQSRIACLHYEQYGTLEEVERDLKARREEIQCVVAQTDTLQRKSYAFGSAQAPELWDYADGKDTLAFLLSL
jgi:hypothetical protein